MKINIRRCWRNACFGVLVGLNIWSAVMRVIMMASPPTHWMAPIGGWLDVAKMVNALWAEVRIMKPSIEGSTNEYFGWVMVMV